MGTDLASVEQLSLLLSLSRSFNALIDLDELLASVTAQTKTVLGAESCALLLHDPEHNELYFPVASDDDAEVEARFKNIRFPADRGVAGWVLQHGQPTLVHDVAQDPRFYGGVDRASGAQTRGLLCAPLRTRSGVLGVIELRNKLDGAFSDDDLAFLDALAGVVAAAIENARLYQQVRASEARLQEEVAVLQREMVHRDRFTDILGSSAAMAKVFTLMESAVPSPITVLLQGETGTGKELIGRAIHAHGPRRHRPFVTVNCGALPETLLESELFGHKRGAFTGAIADKPGLFEAAHGGTIFLDEIGDTAPAMQVKLLRALQHGEIRRVGETQSRQVDVRLISATNRDLDRDVAQGRFREDLYYRISVFPIHVPPLRDRREDIPLLVARFIQQSNARLGKRVPAISPKALQALSQHAWPGNVRELENEIERAVALTLDEDSIAPAALSERITMPRSLRVPLPARAGSLTQARINFEREYIAEVLRQHQGNATKAAQVLGISRQMVQRKIKTYRLRPKR